MCINIVSVSSLLTLVGWFVGFCVTTGISGSTYFVGYEVGCAIENIAFYETYQFKHSSKYRSTSHTSNSLRLLGIGWADVLDIGSDIGLDIGLVDVLVDMLVAMWVH